MFFDNENVNFFEVTNYKNNNEITTALDGLEKGNMFINEYEPYKNYKFSKLKYSNEQEKLLIKIISLSFALNDLNLFLDLNPNDTEKLLIFKKLMNEKNNIENDYIEKYGPLKLNQVSNKTFNWVSSFPWDNYGGVTYV